MHASGITSRLKIANPARLIENHLRQYQFHHRLLRLFLFLLWYNRFLHFPYDNVQKEPLPLQADCENKEETISLIVDLYGFLPVFIKEYNSNSREQNIIDTKYKLLICYKYADLEEWEELYKSVDELKKSFSNIVNKKEDFPKKGVNIKSAEVILNEIYNSVEIKEKEIFFIKYKNFIQELNIILSI